MLSKKIRTTDTNTTINTNTLQVVTIGDFKFVHDELSPFIEVFITDDEKDEYVDEIDQFELSHSVIDHEDLKIVALNWFHNNVEFAKEIE